MGESGGSSSSGEIRLHQVLDNLQGGTQKQRTDAVKDLKAFFDRTHKASNLNVLTDKSYHKIYEVIFKIALTEKKNFLAAKKTTRSTILTRLTSCVDTIRVVVKAGAPKLKGKTVQAVVDHITETLPTLDGGYCEPLAHHYLKALSALFEHPADVERLKQEVWFKVVDFCLQAIDTYLSDNEKNPGLLSRSSSGLGASPAPGATARSTMSNSLSQKREGSLTRQNVEDLFQTVLLLVSNPASPLPERYTALASTTMGFLQLQGSNVGQVHQLAFSILNIVLSYTRADHSSFSQSVAHKVVPIISRFWQGKAVAKDEMLNSVRDEMLICLITIHPHLERSIRNQKSIEILGRLDELLSVFRADYAKRSDRDQLQLDDLDMVDLGSEALNNTPFGLNTFRLKAHDLRAERNWGTLQVIGILERLLCIGRQQNLPTYNDDNDIDLHPGKRQRIIQPTDQLLDPLKSKDEKVRLAGLQALPFVLQEQQLSASCLEELLAQLYHYVSDKRGNVGSWALLAIASCTYQIAITNIDPEEWMQLWHIGTRSLTFPATCRAAGVQLHAILSKKLVQYRDVGEDVASMISSVDTSGPSVLCDSSIFLMSHLLNTRVMEVPGASLLASQHVIRWLFTNWKPVDKSFAAHDAIHVQPHYVTNLLRACLSLHPVNVATFTGLPCGPVAQAWHHHLTTWDTIKYILLLDDSGTRRTFICPSCPKTSGRITHILNTTHFSSTRKLVVELLQPKSDAILQGWRAFVADGSSPLSPEIFRSSVYSCLVMLMLMPHFVKPSTEQVLKIQQTLQEFSKELIEFLSDAYTKSPSRAQTLNETLLQSVQLCLPSCGSSEFKLLSDMGKYLLDFFVLTANETNKRRTISTDTVSVADEDQMDIDDDFSIGRSQTRSEDKKSTLPRTIHSLEMWSGTFFHTILGRLMLIATIKETPDFTDLVPHSFVDYMLSLTDEEILSSRQILQEIFRSDLTFDTNDAQKLVERMGSLLSTGTLNRCEATLGLCLDTLAGLESLWSTTSDSSLRDICSEVHEHFIKLLERGVTSPEIQKGIAALLLLLLRSDRDHGVGEDLSAQSSLFKIIITGNASVKFYIGARLSQIFDFYILQYHDKLFTDILDVLPASKEWIEAISFRLFVLAQLATSWPNLLRRCIYHIFETAGPVPESTEHATRCLKQISSTLKIKSARELFTLFAPQVLYTYLDSENIARFSFRVFGFSNLREFVEDAQEEATALMVMRGQESCVDQIAGILGIDPVQLLKSSFSKVMAYTIAYDLASASARGEGPQFPGEARVKTRLKQEMFFECVNLHFADIICVFFTLIDNTPNVEKYFEKEGYGNAAMIMKELKSYGFSDAKLPANQQPFFRAKHLMEQIRHLCSRTQHEIKNLFTPALVSTIARRLLNTINPALGSLHACSVLRKIRILISLAGAMATQGYPLEMLLQSLRPLITIPECTDDVIGMIQYLLTNGSAYLLGDPSYVAGFSLAILRSLKIFLDSEKANTTQESQHKNTMSKSQAFHSWLGQYFSNYNSSALESPRMRANFQKLVQSAFRADSVGNADINTSESHLLLQLLQDEQMGEEQLLSSSSRDLALTMLCSHFRGPASFRTDILGGDNLSISSAAVVWKSCLGSPSKQYLSWAARVLGRAFAASGYVHKELLLESTMSKITEISNSDDGIDSRECLLCLLEELTLDHKSHTAGLAEAALRTIISNSDGDDEAFRRAVLPGLIKASRWFPYQTSPAETKDSTYQSVSLNEMLDASAISKDQWLRDISIALAQSVSGEPLLNALVPTLRKVQGFASRVFPFLIHLVLSVGDQGQRSHKKELSKSYMNWFANSEAVDKNHLKMLINSILYLRTQPLLNEKSSAERSSWLDIDYLKASTAAIKCGMFKTALIFAEESCSQPAKSSRRSSTIKDSLDQTEIPSDLLLRIFENIDDPDLYYGVQQKAGLSTILARFEYEKDGPKSLAFRGAQYDSHIKNRDPASADDVQSLVKALDVLNLNGLSNSLLQGQQNIGMTPTSLESLFRTARNLEQWDIPVPSTCDNNAVAIYKAFQAIHTATDEANIAQAVNDGFEYAMSRLVSEGLSASALHGSLQTLAALAELDEILSARGSEQFEQVLSRFRERSKWMKIGSFEDINQILSCRGTALSTLNQQRQLQEIIGVKALDTRLVQLHTVLLSSSINRAHGALQESLSLATSMMDLIKPCHEVGLNPEIAIHVEAANALWDQGEIASSISMLQALDNPTLLKRQKFVGRSNLLSKIGHQVSVARLEKADKIIEKYLEPALRELKGVTKGSEAGQVFHQFAVFCDQQLEDPDGKEDLARLERLRKNKGDEVLEYQKLVRSAKSSSEKARYNSYLKKATNWLKLDDEELNRLKASREKFLRQCFENYLLALGASDEHDGNALRFSALWLEHADEEPANDAVSKHLEEVPSRKFAPLMNQLTSRLQRSDFPFQKLLLQLILRICTDHPYHGMYQIYAGVNNKPNQKDESAVSRRDATLIVSTKLGALEKTQQIWGAITTTNKYYCMLAGEKDDQNYKTGKKIPINKSASANALEGVLARYHIPPNTMSISLSPSCDYTNLPHVEKLEPYMTIASGVSLPKIITLRASNGIKYKQLVKGGNDDLRQDAIMEQVFEQVSELLKTSRSTRQRNLSIRTYRVLPLTNIAGVIEFVANTVPLHEWLIPAHERYHPKDLKSNQCRREIGDAQAQSVDARVRKFRSVTERFRPVMRYFFTEKFNDPDTWFATRLAYTRSTAAISILGHVLGLGDRHGHNILIDTKSGEVVHIDLGVAFEMGRVLPVPELVPFRLTRDIVDGMGITKTEGVFRRCCEFTLEALRKEADSIMTILDVLRYDPLYSWSITPVRLAKLQAGQSAAPEPSEIGNIHEKAKESVNEPGEAARALTVVNKKLSKTLSVTATVNDLINQASDERNLAVLYSGWAAYA